MDNVLESLEKGRNATKLMEGWLILSKFDDDYKPLDLKTSNNLRHPPGRPGKNHTEIVQDQAGIRINIAKASRKTDEVHTEEREKGWESVSG